MTVQIALLLVILVITVILFSFEWVSVDVVALGNYGRSFTASALPRVDHGSCMLSP